MKHILTAILLAFHVASYGQCTDIYGSKCDCPTEEDSLVIYNNALKVMLFYDDNKSYQLQKSNELTSKEEKKEVYNRLTEARRYFFTVRQAAKGRKPTKWDVQPKPGYKDITFNEYYQDIDEFRFYQRELENEIVNANATLPMYDTRIWPIVINEYVNIDSNDIYFGDLVQIPLYIPVVVKPYTLLTGAELALRNKILHIIAKDSSIVIKPDNRQMIKKVPTDTVFIGPKQEYQPKIEGTPIYCYNSYGSASIIGFIDKHVFYKLRPYQYTEYAVQKFAIEVLEDEYKLKLILFNKFGDYISEVK